MKSSARNTEPFIVHEVGLDGRERQRADAESGSGGFALANLTRGTRTSEPRPLLPMS
jgi:hypothetical protein